MIGRRQGYFTIGSCLRGTDTVRSLHDAQRCGSASGVVDNGRAERSLNSKAQTSEQRRTRVSQQQPDVVVYMFAIGFISNDVPHFF